MFGLPSDFDTNCFLGRVLELICINENTVYFHFDREILISVESAYAYHGGELEAIELLVEIPEFNSKILKLLGCSVNSTQGTAEGTLILEFEEGKKLKIFDTSPQYESYHITYEGKTITV